MRRRDFVGMLGGAMRSQQLRRHPCNRAPRPAALASEIGNANAKGVERVGKRRQQIS